MLPSFSLTELLPDTGIVSIVHVGARMYDGHEESYEHLVKLGRARLIGFEPDPAECKRMASRYPPPGYTFLPFFVGSGDVGTFHETASPSAASLYRPDMQRLARFHNLADLFEVGATRSVVTQRLDDIPGVEAMNFLKIDVQGAEMDVFEGAARLLSTCDVIQAEVEFVALYEGQPMFADVDRHLRAQGFQFHTFLDFGGRCFKPLVANQNPNQGLRQYLWADAVYVRDFMNFAQIPTERLAALAIILHDIYSSVDLCMVALTEIDRRVGKGPRLEKAYFQRLQQKQG